MVLQVDKGTAHLFGAALSKLIQVDIANVTWAHAVVGQHRQLDIAARNLELHLLTCRGAFHFEHKAGAGIATQVRAHITHVLVGHRRIVDAQDDVALVQSHLGSRHTLIGLVDHGMLQACVILY